MQLRMESTLIVAIGLIVNEHLRIEAGGVINAGANVADVYGPILDPGGVFDFPVSVILPHDVNRARPL